MKEIEKLDRIAISAKSHKFCKILLQENPRLDEIIRNSKNETEALVGVKDWIEKEFDSSREAFMFQQAISSNRELFDKLKWRDFAIIRILDYIEHAGKEFPDLNLHGEIAVSNPIKLIWLAVNHGTGGAKSDFFKDMIQLFRQLNGKSHQKIPENKKVLEWMKRYPSGLDPRIVLLRKENRDRILNIIISRIESQEITGERYFFEEGLNAAQKMEKALEWWKDHRFHLRFAVRSPDLLNEMLGHSLDPDTMKLLKEAEEAGIPFFVNPYYLSLLQVRVPYFAIGADLAIRHYVVYSKQLVEEFGHIVAWEKEDQVMSGKPNAAGWILPAYNNIHRRYPEVAILIPDSMGRTCGGLCSCCQRMYDFQSGNLTFDLKKLAPNEKWPEKLKRLLDYFENDAQLRDILITGGDALMSSDETLKHLLKEVLAMVRRKRAANRKKPDGEKYAEIQRIRLGTRLLAYLPQRITQALADILTEFKKAGSKEGIQKFVIQTHFESPMEVTPEARVAVRRLIGAGWMVTNQLVFTVAASRRGHTARLRQVLNDIGILPYYTFTVKGYMENNFNFATNARLVQEMMEEKPIGGIGEDYIETIKSFPEEAEMMVENIEALRKHINVPFLATDRNVLNLPGVGKSLTFRVIGITRYGRRILEFDHDETRNHSPIIRKMGKVIIVESKSIQEYLEQLENIGEDISEYEGLYGYTFGQTEKRIPIYDYPEFEYELTKAYSNLEV
ncbi:MAG: KamA family protein [Bacteroidales bacterium]|nr:KamA family protein [Bacteroidales bacterium]